MSGRGRRVFRVCDQGTGWAMIFDVALSLVIGLYALVALFAVLATTSEQKRKGIQALGPRLMSLAACLVWPLMAALMFLLQTTPSRR